MVGGLRWWIVELGLVIIAQLHPGNSEFAGLTTVFLIAYTLSRGLPSKLHNGIGTRPGFDALRAMRLVLMGDVLERRAAPPLARPA
jgi:hypothetical protein